MCLFKAEFYVINRIWQIYKRNFHLKQKCNIDKDLISHAIFPKQNFWPNVTWNWVRDVDAEDRKFFLQVPSKLKAVGLMHDTMRSVVTLSYKQYLILSKQNYYVLCAISISSSGFPLVLNKRRMKRALNGSHYPKLQRCIIEWKKY